MIVLSRLKNEDYLKSIRIFRFYYKLPVILLVMSRLLVFNTVSIQTVLEYGDLKHFVNDCRLELKYHYEEQHKAKQFFIYKQFEDHFSDKSLI